MAKFKLIAGGMSDDDDSENRHDFGRFKFEQQKIAREIKKKHHIVDVKDIKMRYKIEDHDYQVKLRNAHTLLTQGETVIVEIFLRGREMQHSKMAIDLMNRFSGDLKDVAIIDRQPHLEGKSVIMVLSAIPPGDNPLLVERPDPKSGV